MPDCLSLNAQDLIRRMLNPIPHMRISLDEMKEHPWFMDDGEGIMEDSVIPRFVGGLMCSYRKASEKEILIKMKELGFPCEFVYQSLKFREINHVTATYYLLEISTTI